MINVEIWLRNNPSCTFYSSDGIIIAEKDLQGNVTKEYIYLDDELLALIEPGNPASTILYAHNDHLGTPHMLTDEGGVECGV